MKALIAASAMFCSMNDTSVKDWAYHCMDTLHDCQVVTDATSGASESGHTFCSVYVNGRWKRIWTYFETACILANGQKVCGVVPK